jgi:hypothetical protein
MKIHMKSLFGYKPKFDAIDLNIKSNFRLYELVGTSKLPTIFILKI